MGSWSHSELWSGAEHHFILLHSHNVFSSYLPQAEAGQAEKRISSGFCGGAQGVDLLTEHHAKESDPKPLVLFESRMSKPLYILMI